MSDDRYARVYFDRIARDEKFDGIRDNRHLMGSWLMLLIEAEKAWPAPAFPLPRTWVPTADVRLFADRELIDIEPDSRYRMHGLDAERSVRSSRGRDAAVARWSTTDGNASGIAEGNANGNASHARARRLVSSRSDLPEGGVGGDDGRLDLEAWLLVRYRPPTPRQREFLDAYVRTFDVTGPQRAERIILANPADPIAALKADLDAFRVERRDAANAAEEPQRRSGVEATIRRNHATGFHDAAPDPRCPECAA